MEAPRRLPLAVASDSDSRTGIARVTGRSHDYLVGRPGAEERIQRSSRSRPSAHSLPTRPPSTGAAAEIVLSLRRTETTGKGAVPRPHHVCWLVCRGGFDLGSDACVALRRPSGRAVWGQREDADPSGEESTYFCKC